MKVTITKTDLETALNSTGHSIGKEAGSWTKHYFFRSTKSGVEVHTTNHRHCSSVSISSVTVADTEDGDTFTLESSRVRKWLQFINTSNALVFDIDSSVESEYGSRGSSLVLC